MKQCSNCGMQLEDNARFCTGCGTPTGQTQQEQNGWKGQQETVQPQQDRQQNNYGGGSSSFMYDHTSEFDPQDISDNKVIAMLCYLMGTIGIIIALLTQSNSRYVAFHLRQALKITVVEMLVGLASVFLFWTIVVPLLGSVLIFALFVVRVINFFSICNGKAVESPIVRSLGFLR